MSDATFEHIGRIVVIWSRIETSISMDLHSMRRYANIAALSPDIPQAFKKRLELWRRSVRKLYPSIEQYQELATAFKSRAKVAARLRNHIIHGSWNLDPNEDGSFTVTNITGGRADQVPVTEAMLAELIAEIENLDMLIASFFVSKMLHAHHGLLRLQPEPSPESPALQNPPKPSKP